MMRNYRWLSLVAVASSALAACTTEVPSDEENTGAAAAAATTPAAGWLYTSGNRIYYAGADGGSSHWKGRGVNIDDVFLCGYNSGLWMSSPDQTLETIASGLVANWKPNFVRVSLAMNSWGAESWTAPTSNYRTEMTNVINALTKSNVYVLVTLRSHPSMIDQDTNSGDAEATGLPSDATTTPDHTAFPTGTDATYVALVDSFASSKRILFGISNEPGGNTLSNATIAAAMSHAVGVIRSEEDRLGVAHHLVAVQGNSWTSDVSFYNSSPLPYDNVVYEVHGYPPSTSSYTYSNIPVIIGEYGSLSSSAASAFYSDVESKGIPNLAWDFEPYSNCAPDLLEVTYSSTQLTPTAWGTIVQNYLLSHAH